MKKRLMVAGVLAAMITAAIFLFMHHLIHRSSQSLQMIEIAGIVELYHPPKQKPQQKRPPERIKQRMPSRQEPSMDTLSVAAPEVAPQLAPGMSQPLPGLSLDSLQLPIGAFGSAGGSGVAPIAGYDTDLIQQLGQDNKGFIEVVPYTTRQPNIPELAWEKKVDGWVLVAFKVTLEGFTKDIRVLDASPRGLYEEKVVAAVNDWRYSVKVPANHKGDLVLTQKIELFWKNFPNNVMGVD